MHRGRSKPFRRSHIYIAISPELWEPGNPVFGLFLNKEGLVEVLWHNYTGVKEVPFATMVLAIKYHLLELIRCLHASLFWLLYVCQLDWFICLCVLLYSGKIVFTFVTLYTKCTALVSLCVVRNLITKTDIWIDGFHLQYLVMLKFSLHFFQQWKSKSLSKRAWGHNFTRLLTIFVFPGERRQAQRLILRYSQKVSVH